MERSFVETVARHENFLRRRFRPFVALQTTEREQFASIHYEFGASPPGGSELLKTNRYCWHPAYSAKYSIYMYIKEWIDVRVINENCSWNWKLFTSKPWYTPGEWRTVLREKSVQRVYNGLEKFCPFVAFYIIHNNVRLRVSARDDYKLYTINESGVRYQCGNNS
jgi:hypothetical protein